MQRTLLTMGDSTRLAEIFVSGLEGRQLFFSYGEIIPDLREYDTSFWMGGRYAAQLQQVGLAGMLCSPGVDWLPNLDVSLSGRVVHFGVLTDLMCYGDQVLWVKPAEAKIQSFPAGAYTHSQLTQIYVDNELPANVNIQWTETIMRIDFEHRFFIVGNEVVTGSPYKMGDMIYNRNISWAQYENAERFMKRVLKESPVNPPAFVVDVGFNVDSGEWFVIEANRAWSSGLYGCDAHMVLAAVDVASHYVGDAWAWVPDAHLVDVVTKLPALTVVDANSETMGFHLFKPLPVTQYVGVF